MSRIHLRSHTLLLWLSLSAAAALVSVACSSSDDTSATASGGKGGGGHSGGSASKAGSASSDAGDAAMAGETGGPDEARGGGTSETPTGGSGGSGATGGGSVAGGPSASDDAGATGEGGAAGSPVAVDPEIAAAQVRALGLINGLEVTRKCTSCHDVTYQGSGFYPNITPDLDTGIGSWDAEEIKTAIRDGKDKDGKTLCATMERYAFSEAQLSDLVIYLQHLTPVKKKITGKCPSL